MRVSGMERRTNVWVLKETGTKNKEQVVGES